MKAEWSEGLLAATSLIFFSTLSSAQLLPFSLNRNFFSTVPTCLPSNSLMTNLRMYPLLQFKSPAPFKWKWKIRELLVTVTESERQDSATSAFQQQVTVPVLLRSEKAQRLTKGYLTVTLAKPRIAPLCTKQTCQSLATSLLFHGKKQLNYQVVALLLLCPIF